MANDQLGYDDTPYLPHVDYRVHDPERPQPPVVDPGEPVTNDPPEDATVLLGESGAAGWTHTDGRELEWRIDDGVFEVEPGSGDVRTEAAFGDCQLHLEWATPEEREGSSQGIGNSGVFLMDLYEIQVLDNYENPTYADGYAGAVYGQHPPLVNACRPSGEWQSYDIVWNAPRFDDDELAEPATVTVLHNGVVIQHATEVLGTTGHRTLPEYEPHPSEGHLRLQDHGDRVRFRNVWYREL